MVSPVTCLGSSLGGGMVPFPLNPPMVYFVCCEHGFSRISALSVHTTQLHGPWFTNRVPGRVGEHWYSVDRA